MWRLLRPDAVAVLQNEKCRTSLARYFDVSDNLKHAKFQIAKRLEASFTSQDSLESLWCLHEKLSKDFRRLEGKLDAGKVGLEELPQPPLSYMDLKIEIAKRILQNCHFCRRNCGANRLQGKRGTCLCGTQPAVSSYFAHMGEEPELIPSGTVFTLGCTLRCLHCQNWTISQWVERGETYTPTMLADVVERLRRGGCKNANLVGGEPTPWLAQWLEVFRKVQVNVPVVWNSNSYYSEESARLLAGFADVYLLDFKYGNDACAERISGCQGYWEAATQNHLHALKNGELIVRMLILPEHGECCAKPILRWMAENLGTWIRVNIMDQYRPEWRADEVPELRRRLRGQEFRSVVDYARELGFANLAS